MSDLIVVTFDNPDEAGQLRKTLKDVQHHGGLRIDDIAVLSCDADGKVHVRDEVDVGVKWGAVGGGLIGLLLSFMFPLAGLAIGLAGGALAGRLADFGIDKKFIADVRDSLTPNSSALFAIISGADPSRAVAAFEPYRGTLYHTSLPSDLEEQLRNALK